jgi:hypothetical protein
MKKPSVVEVISSKTLKDTADELIVERLIRVSGATRMEAEWAGPSYVWAAEDRPQSGKRSVRIRSAELERRGVWLIRAEFSVEPRPI